MLNLCCTSCVLFLVSCVQTLLMRKGILSEEEARLFTANTSCRHLLMAQLVLHFLFSASSCAPHADAADAQGHSQRGGGALLHCADGAGH
jgi:hypothetical protein